MMQRRDFITVLGGAAAWPLTARAQQPALPVVGFLDPGAPQPSASNAAAFRKGLSEAGYVEGRNVTIEYRWAQNDSNRLLELAADLVRHRVAVIVATTFTAALPAKAATATIPIVFSSGVDPVQAGLVASYNRPGGNITGVSYMISELMAKRLGLLHALAPGAARIAALVQPSSPTTQAVIADLRTAAATIGQELEILYADDIRGIDTAFASLAQKRVDALLLAPTPSLLFLNRRVQLVTLAVRHAVPVIYPSREYVEAGGLMSYAADIADQYRQVGLYTGRILKGEKPADLPVMQPTKFELVINLQTAKLLGIEVPAMLLAQADEVIE
jgi:putative ABC transport system substrate-binding protein